MRYVLSVLAIFIFVGCEQPATQDSAVSSVSCKGVYYDRDSAGTLHKFNQYELNGACYTDNVPLSQFEKTQESWVKNNVRCTPQSFPSMTLIAANNYYSYRDGKAFLDLDSTTGIYRRIVIAEDTSGKPVYTKLQGCFYERTGTGVDSSFGQQLLLDTDINKLVTTQNFDPMEIFQVNIAGANVNMLRFDDISDYDYRNCPYLSTPWEFCTKLRNGNEMYFPILPAQDQTDLKNEAIVISKQYNWASTSKNIFNNLWNNPPGAEAIREDYRFDVIHIPDTPRYLDQAWRDYVMGNRPFMPDVNSLTSVNLCYHGSKNVTLADGSTGKIYGEICYVDGQYTFTQN